MTVCLQIVKSFDSIDACSAQSQLSRRQLLAVRVQVTFDLSTFSEIVFPEMIVWLRQWHQKT